jgi:hypothetical protein
VTNNINKTIDYLLSDYKFGRYLEDKDLPSDQSLRLQKDIILNIVIQRTSEYLTIEDSNKDPQGIVVFRLSDWDTRHFGFKTVIIEYFIVRENDPAEYLKMGNGLLNLLIERCKKDGVKFVVAKPPSLDLLSIHCLEEVGFNFIESWVYCKYDIRKNNPNYTEYLNLRLANKSDLDYMLAYSTDAFITQRFHADYHIPREKADALYTKWILTAFNDPVQRILVYEENNIPCAFMIYFIQDLNSYYNKRFAMWKMALLNPLLKGKGMGTKFFMSVCNYHKSENLDIVDSGLSIRNLVSLNTHNKSNFKVVSSLVTMHLWL